MSEAVESVSIENVVASAAIGQEIDLRAVEVDLEDVEFKPGEFPGLIYRGVESDASALIFRSGKIVSTGAPSVTDARRCLYDVFATLSELGLDASEPEVTVQNIVSSADLGQSLNLNALAIGLGLEAIEYEPEQFPGLVYRLTEPDVVTLLFGSGKVIITGSRVKDEAPAAVGNIEEELGNLGL